MLVGGGKKRKCHVRFFEILQFPLLLFLRHRKIQRKSVQILATSEVQRRKEREGREKILWFQQSVVLPNHVVIFARSPRVDFVVSRFALSIFDPSISAL